MSDVALRFGATDDGLTAAFRRVNQQVESFQRGVTRAGADIKSAFSSVTGIVGGITFAAAVREVAEFADTLVNLKDQTGIAVDSLQRLSFISGQTSGDLTTIASAVGRMQKALVLAGEGSEQATEALGRLGIPLAEFRSLTPDAQFEKVAQAIARIEDPAQRATAAIGLFGKSGAELLPVLIQTGNSLEEIDAKFAAIGGPVATSAIEKVDQLGDTFGVVTTAAKSLLTEVVALFAPPVIAGLESVGSALGSVRLLLGGGSEIQQLQRQIEILTEAKNSIPLFFDFGYTEAGARVLAGPQAIQDQIDKIQAKLRDLRATQFSAPTVVDVDVPTPDVPDFSAKSPKADKPTLDAESQKRIQALQDDALRQEFADKALADQARQNQRLEELNARHVEELKRQDLDYSTVKLEQQSALGAALADLRSQYGIAEINFEELKSASIQQINASLASSLLTIATSAFGQNKKVALAVAGINIAVGMSKALELPFPANIAAAAKVAAQGAQILASIRSTSIGGGAGIGGSVGAAGVSQTPGTENRPDAKGASVQPAVQVYINGVVTQKVLDELWKGFEDKFDRGAVLFSGNTRQAIELAPA